MKIVYTFLDIFLIIGPNVFILSKFEFSIEILLISPLILISEPFDKTFLMVKFLIVNSLSSSPESYKINDESPISPIHETFSISILFKLISWYWKYKIVFEFEIIFLNFTLLNLIFDSSWNKLFDNLLNTLLYY